MKRLGNVRLLLAVALAGVCAGGLASCLGPGGPQVTITVTPSSGVVPLTIAFDGTSSTAAGGVTTYHWVFGTGDESYESTGTYTFVHAGTFVLSLTVRAADGSSSTESAEIVVGPAVWITDSNLGRIYKLDMSGKALLTFNSPSPQPQGITLAEAEGRLWLFVACQGGGLQRIYRLDPTDGSVTGEFSAPGQSPRELTYGADTLKRIWCVDGTSRTFYALDPTTGQVFESFGLSYFNSFPQVRKDSFLRTPAGLDWTPQALASGYLWYLEGENGLLFKMKIVPSYDIMSGTQLELVGDPLHVPISAVTAIDWDGGYLWVVDVNEHEIVQIDPETGERTGVKITRFPGAATAGMEIER